LQTIFLAVGVAVFGNAACAAKEPHDVDGLYVIVAPCFFAIELCH
jgi:hypothetical protein